MTIRILNRLILTLLILAIKPAFSQDIILNGSMEIGPGGAATLPDDWTFVSDSPDNCASPPALCMGPSYVINVPSPDADRWVRFFRGGGWNERFGQYLCTPLVEGETYTLEFWASHSDLNASATATSTGIDFGFSTGLPGGTGAGTENSDDVDLVTPETWVFVTHTFVATGDYDFISFAKNTTDVDNAAYVDGVTLTLDGGGAAILPNDTTLCEGESLLLDVSAFTGPYLWQDGSTDDTFEVTVAGEYYVDLVGDCSFSDTINVTFAPPALVGLGSDTTLCEGESLLLDVSGYAGPYLWQDGSTDDTFEVTVTGEYYVDLGGDCAQSDTINVTFVIGAIVDFGADTTLCEGESLLLDVSDSPGPYLWHDGSTENMFNVTVAGEYYCTLGSGFCIGTDTINVDFITADIIDFGADTTLCEGEILLLDASDAAGPYLWQDGSTSATFNVASTGEYYVTAGAGLCPSTDTINVTFIPLPVVGFGSDTALCIGADLLLDASSAVGPYTWQDGSTAATFSVTDAGTYWVEVGDVCIVRDSITIGLISVSLTMGLDDSENCGPYTVNFNADAITSGTGIASWDWSFGDGGSEFIQNPSHLYTATGTYSVSLTVTTDEGCVQTLTYSDWVMVYEIPVALFSCNPMSLTTENTQVKFIDESINAHTWDWTFGNAGDVSNDQNPTYSFPATIGEYPVELMVTSEDGCTDIIQKMITVTDERLFYIPNAFTPDGDLFNETFSPVFFSGVDPFDFHMIIFNRWGEVVFESYNKDIGWDGTFGNKGLVQDGTYVWQVDFKSIGSDKRQTFTGHVNLLK